MIGFIWEWLDFNTVQRAAQRSPAIIWSCVLRVSFQHWTFAPSWTLNWKNFCPLHLYLAREYSPVGVGLASDLNQYILESIFDFLRFEPREGIPIWLKVEFGGSSKLESLKIRKSTKNPVSLWLTEEVWSWIKRRVKKIKTSFFCVFYFFGPFSKWIFSLLGSNFGVDTCDCFNVPPVFSTRFGCSLPPSEWISLSGNF